MDTDELAHRLTMIGHEVDELERWGGGLDGVVVGEILAVEKHPNADRLSLCTVSAGGESSIEVVCGAPNVRVGLKSPFAPAGTRLPDGTKLRRTKIRGVESNGMLCSAIELALGDESDGILELDDAAIVGSTLVEHLDLPDASFDLALTPNRGDCFSVLGIARDVSAMTSISVKDPAVTAVQATVTDEHPVALEEPIGCPRFAGRVVRNIDMTANSPDWLKERLRRSGLRSIHPVVDVTNYVMMELGQPLHAYDQSKLHGTVRPRMADIGEKLVLLDEKEITLQNNTLVIADDSGPIGMAGIMGGLSTAVTTDTKDVFFEAAFFSPAVMAGVARQYGMHTDASMRFERGVDPANQARAIERATQLLIEIAGGDPGPLIDNVDSLHLPKPGSMTLRSSRLARILGMDVPADTVTEILVNLGLDAVANDNGWTVQIPSHRFDIDVEDALVEEVARIYGYDEIPEITAIADTPLASDTESLIGLDAVADALVGRDYQEVVTYSFIDKETDAIVSGVKSELVLSNPISSEMTVMRSSVWPGLLGTAASNLARQQDRVRIFEIGKTFHGKLGASIEIMRVSGLITGDALPQQWGSPLQPAEFFDIKSDVENILGMTGALREFEFAAVEHRFLQPGQTAQIERSGDTVGIVGKLHPRYARKVGLEKDVSLFELDAETCFASAIPVAKIVSKFPAIRRDIAVVVDEMLTSNALISTIESAAPELVRKVTVFDVYQGPGIEVGRKSIALGLILQETSRTLTDDDADTVMSAVLRKLQQDFGAELRD
jgi:phenylalanyl-tRNA synthetase beta chain